MKFLSKIKHLFDYKFSVRVKHYYDKSYCVQYAHYRLFKSWYTIDRWIGDPYYTWCPELHNFKVAEEYAESIKSYDQILSRYDYYYDKRKKDLAQQDKNYKENVPYYTKIIKK